MDQWSTKRKLLIDSLLACTFLALVIFAIVYLFLFNKSSEEMATASSEQNTIFKTDDPFVQTVHIKNNTDKGNYSIQYPKTTSKKLNEAVKESITTAKEEFLATHSKSSTLVVDYKFVIHKKLYSFVLLTKVTQGSSITENNIHTFIVNSQNKELIGLSDIIPNQKKLINILPLIQKDFAKIPAVKSYNSQQKNKLALHTDLVHYQQVALSNKNLYFYFANEQYSRAFNKTTRVAIPLKNIQSSLAKSLKKPVVKTVPVKAVALTFDDGPNPKSTVLILDILKKEKIPATFFILGKQAKKYPAIVKRIKEEGHEIGNHSYSHPKLTKLTTKQLEAEFDKTNHYIKLATGQNPTVFRPPYGAYNDKVVKLAKLPNVLWTVDTLDWKNHSTQNIIATINAQKTQYSTILMHDIHMTSAKALPAVIKQLRQDHYSFVTSSEMMLIQNKTN